MLRRTAVLLTISVFVAALICAPSAAQNTDLKTLIETGK
jgi:hypothetical protein